jgi:hypothetical protein
MPINCYDNPLKGGTPSSKLKFSLFLVRELSLSNLKAD